MFIFRDDDSKPVDDVTLDAPVCMSSLVNTFNDNILDNSIWMVKKDSSSVVDLKKLEKAEAKIREKQDKKGTVPSKYAYRQTR